MWELRYIFWNWLKFLRNDQKYVGNDLDLWEMAQVCGEMTLLFDKRFKNVDNDSEIWEMAKIFGKWLRYMRHGFSI